MKVEVVVAAAAGHRHEKLFETGSTFRVDDGRS